MKSKIALAAGATQFEAWPVPSVVSARLKYRVKGPEKPAVSVPTSTLRHNDHGGEFLNTFDTGRSAVQKLVKPEVGVARVYGQCLQGSWKKRKTQVGRAQKFCVEQREQIFYFGHVADQFSPLL